ncbi:EAL domain-containing protein [Methylophaga sp.]|uniref:EAL domain-containing protein n=1 Tax=Methylophaga sp. TaxID=2024840 RepID=UPI003F6A3858
MTKSWSIKKMLQFWATATIVVVVVMTLMANFANIRISSSQQIFSETLLPLENSSRELTTVIASLISRQKQFLAADSILTLKQHTDRAETEQVFLQNWLRLSSSFDGKKDREALVNSLFDYYQDFLTLDNELFLLKEKGLVVSERLKRHRDDIDLQADNIRQLLSQLEQQLRRNNILSGIPLLENVRTVLYQLESLNTEIVLTQNADQLDKLTAQKQAPIKQTTQSHIRSLKNRLQAFPALINQATEIEKDLQIMVALLFEEDGLHRLHQQALLNRVLLEQGEQSAMAVISVLKNKIARLADRVNQQTYQAVSDNVDLADRTRWQVIVLSGLITFVMVFFAFMLFHRINQPLHLIRQSMHKLAEGKFDTRIEHMQAEDDISLLMTDFNVFAGNTEQLINELAQAHQLVQNSEEHIRAILNAVPEAILTLTLNGEIKQVNPAAESILGASQEVLAGKNVLRFFSNKSLVQSFNDIIEQSAAGTDFEGERYDGTAISMDLSLSRVGTEENEDVWVCVISDVTDSKLTQRRLEQTTVELNTILDNAMVGIAFVRDRHFIRVNQKFCELFGYPREEIEGQNSQCIYLNTNAYEQFGDEAYHQLTLGDNYDAQLEMVRSDGHSFWCGMSGKAIDPENPKDGSIWLFEDISTQRDNEEHLTRLASIDVLTGLANRTVFMDRVEHAIHKSLRDSGRLAVLFLDLDHFKQINDSLGHKAGDMLLEEVAKRIKLCLREGDTVARLGGDEFTLLLEDIRSAEHVGKVAEKVAHEIIKPFQLEATEVTISPSIGISLYPADGRDVDMLIRNADAAMYHAKKSGRNNFQFYSVEMNAETAKRLAMETALRRAIEKQELQLYYQPQIDLQTGEIVGAEALLRWHTEQWGHVSPAEFVPILEDTGLIGPVGEWILKEACITYMELAERLSDQFRMAVNLSSRQFKGGLLASSVRRILQELNMPPMHLELEITETMLMEDTVLASHTLAELSEMNISLAIDDFGTGYSSLSYLKQFPLNVLKIDGSFVRDIAMDGGDAAIVNAILALSKSLGLKVVAEGVETVEQLDYFRSHDCHLAQGYLFSKAVDKEGFNRLLDRETWI